MQSDEITNAVRSFAFAVKIHEIFEKNMAQFVLLTDKIRNPLTAIALLLEGISEDKRINPITLRESIVYIEKVNIMD